MPDLLNLQLDVWSPLSHKRTMTGNPTDDYGRPQWLDELDWRRLSAYKLRLAYLRNVVRYYIGKPDPNEPDTGDRDDFREYGDAALIRDQAVSAVLGEDQTIVVDGADNNDGTPPDGVDQAAAAERQDWLRQWADDERLPAKMVEGERQAVGLGDNVYVLTWDARKQRPRLRVYDPGLFFPVIDEARDDFPTRAHLLWEIPPTPGTDERPRIRRRTWELAPIGPATSEQPTEGGMLRRLFSGGSTTADDAQLYAGDSRAADGTITRSYPWQAPGEAPSSTTCYYSDATWDVGDLKGEWNADTLPLSKAAFARNDEGELLDRVDLRVDFLPIVHEPNNVAGQEMWGNSVIDVVAQLLDDLSSDDTDLQRASATTGSPMLALSGAQTAGDLDVGPGEVFELGESGSMTALDTSPNLLALTQIVARLLDRLSVNSRLPAVALGRVDPSAIPSGVALALTFGPMKSLINEMRLVRAEKYPLLLKFAQRIAQAGGVLDPGETPRAEIRLGPFMPADQAGTAANVVALLAAKAISKRTGLLMLQEAGYPIEDIADELEQIQQADTEAARNLFEATGNSDAAAQRLGLAPPTPPPAPTLNLPGQQTSGDGQAQQ